MSQSPVGKTDPAAVVLYGPASLPPPTESMHDIQFHHPGYLDGLCILFSLPRLDRSPTSSPGVHYGTALTACQIVANNAFHGYLATDREGSERVDPDSDLDRDHLLTKSDYWFIVPADEDAGPNPLPYPVVPSFRDWTFPHREIPNWPQPQFPPGVDTDPSRCIVTRVGGLVNSCHIIPAADEKWFTANGMASWYGDINDCTNKIILRHDLHYALDAHSFAFVPKGNHYVIHQFLAKSLHQKEFASAFHNHIVSLPPDVVPALLFARFARAVLTLVKAFIARNDVGRNVVRLQALNDKEHGKVGYIRKIEWLSAEQLANQYSGADIKSASPTKRKRNHGTPVDNRQESIKDNDNTNGRSEDDDSDSDRESRGPSRKRRRGDFDDMDGEWYDKNVAPLLEDGRGWSPKWLGGNLDDINGEWYDKNVGVLLEEGRGRSRRRRCDDSGVEAGWPSRDNDSQPPSLSSSISSVQLCKGLRRDTSPYASIEVQKQDPLEQDRNKSIIEGKQLC
ncbi:putative conserved hypothetical protein [Rosellinia necatrix]|uniref:HNH nuclease domain-containing protein n=1 Tax=Rosellinia necatrix TaxID=77044 RepID=A0A1W2TK88_ROSNE|nr:putative conserved hypothetical protein [Rosellinia necatrix]